MANPKRSAKDAAQSALPDSIALTDVEAALAARVAPGETVVWAEDTPAFKEALRALNRIETRHNLTLAECHQLREALSLEVFRRQLDPELPGKAPELWSERKGTKDNPVTFIRRVYAPWLGRGLRRSHLHSLDRALYTALGVWLHRHRDSGFPELDG
ncbi:hypothetical protein [Hyphomicrobium sp.]|uniref:hypothetical protein n=1 Tax=Hyphomicrobium sp. TaxID=82 RepID=UPI0025BD1F05|nr:hypothetical protein [Hyphomicrobium sp.]MCC7252388.1 hypothetical protein [Hyphomicrobium sp.]